MGLMDMLKSQVSKQVDKRTGQGQDATKTGGTARKTRRIRMRRGTGTQPGQRP